MYIERADILYSVELRDQLHNSTYSLMRFSLYLLTSTDYCNRGAVHEGPPQYKNHLTLKLKQGTYRIGTAHINFKGWQGSKSVRGDRIREESKVH